MIYLKALIILISLYLHSSDLNKKEILYKVNEYRVSGCKCGRTSMEPVPPLVWNDVLSHSAMSHAEDMRQNHYFSHTSKKGENVGERVSKFNYNWAVVGENIAAGQSSFDEALKDWMKSTSHCKMIMDPTVKEIGVARSGNYWVQHFGTEKARPQK